MGYCYVVLSTQNNLDPTMRNVETINADLSRTHEELTAVEQRFYQQQPVNEKLGRHMVDLRAKIAGLYDELGRALCSGPEAKLNPFLLTLAEAAKLVDRDPATLRQAVLRGALKAEKLGRDWFVKESDLKRYMAQAARRGADR